MTLRDKLLATKCREISQEINGDRVLIVSVKKSKNAALKAQCFSKKDYTFDTNKWENLLLAECVRDTETGTQLLSADEWNDLPNEVSQPFVEAVTDVVGIRQTFEKQEEKDVKN